MHNCDNRLSKVVLTDKLTIDTTACQAVKLDWTERAITPTELPMVAGVISVNVALTKVNLSVNTCFDAESAKALADVIPTSSIQTLVIGPKATVVPVHGSDATSLEFSNQGLGPGELIVISSAISIIPGLLEVKLGGNAAITVADIEALQQLHSNVNFKT